MNKFTFKTVGFRVLGALVALGGLVASLPVYAYVRGQTNSSVSLSNVASNIFSIEQSTNALIKFISIAAGAGLMVAAVGLFYSHWQNPGQVPLSKPISMILLGAALVILALIPMAIIGTSE